MSTCWAASNRVCMAVQSCLVMAEATDTALHQSRARIGVWCESDAGHAAEVSRLCFLGKNTIYFKRIYYIELEQDKIYTTS